MRIDADTARNVPPRINADEFYHPHKSVKISVNQRANAEQWRVPGEVNHLSTQRKIKQYRSLCSLLRDSKLQIHSNLRIPMHFLHFICRFALFVVLHR